MFYSKSFIKNTDSEGIVLSLAFAPHIYSVRSYSKWGSCKSRVLCFEKNRLQVFFKFTFSDGISLHLHKKLSMYSTQLYSNYVNCELSKVYDVYRNSLMLTSIILSGTAKCVSNRSSQGNLSVFEITRA